MSEPPPAYKEIPGEDLVAELAKMKAMMEQMRLDKERLETEAKRKAEEDAAKKREETEAKENKDRVAMYKERQDVLIKYLGEDRSLSDGSFSQKISKEIQTRMILYSMGAEQGRTDRGEEFRMIYTSKLFITAKHVFAYSRGAGLDMDFHPVYTFQNELATKELRLLDQLFRVEGNSDNKILTYNCERLGGTPTSIERRMCKGGVNVWRKFESIIRLIPGSYKNGDWRQLDGFFGMYFNETTMEVSEVPPSL
jgi:hypothetical protein